MASIRAVGGNDPLSLSRGWKDYFLCCFMRGSPSGAGLRGGTNPRGSTAGGGPLPPGGIVDYGSSKSEYVQVISRSAAGDDDYSDCDESHQTNTPSSPVRRERSGEEGARKKSHAEEGARKKSHAGCTVSTSSESRETTGKLTTTTTLERKLGATANHSTYGEGRIEEEDGELNDDEHHHDKSSIHRSVAAEEERVVATAMMSVTTVATVGAVGVAVSPASAADHESSSSSVMVMVTESKHAWTSSSGNDTLDASHLFDTSDLHFNKSLSSCGSVRMTIAYNDTRELLNVTVHEARDIPSGERGGANQTQVRMLLLPARKIRQRTKVKSGENPQFEEVLDFRVARDDVSSMGLRIRLYGCERFRRECLIGETIYSLSSINTDLGSSIHLTTNINLEPRNSLSHGDSLSDVSSLAPSDCSSSTLSLQHGGTPELMIGLAYNATTGRMSVEVIKGSNFRNVATKRRPDTYVKMTLTSPNGEEITSSKTSVRRGQANPLFKEMFVFQVAQFQLPDVSLLVSIFAQRSLKRKDTIGWFSLGNTSSSEEEQGHWSAMLSSKGEQVCRWHALLEP